MTTIGLIVNPIAGMGGSVGLKGTDGEMAARARALGAEPVTPARTAAFLAALEEANLSRVRLPRAHLHWLVAPGPMGADLAAALDAVVVGPGSVGPIEEDIVRDDTVRDGRIGPVTSAEDTRRIALAMIAAGAALLVFVGGDGTARDICDAVGARIPVVGVPAGVKVYSGAFALSPRAAAEMVIAFAEDADLTEAEVLDIDEAAFRENRLDARHYGYLLVPNVQPYLQPSKEGSAGTADTRENKLEIAAAFVEQMDPDTLYLLGPGTTVKAIADELGVAKTLLGIDAVYQGALVGVDLNEAGILALLERYPRRAIVVTPLGGNGFIFGRGNKPFTPAVLGAVGRAHIVVVATEDKMRQVGVLRVDTGDPEVDTLLVGYWEVIIGYDIARVAKVQAA